MLIHVLDANVISNLGTVVLFIITISEGHLLVATALLKSKTLLLPRVHLGVNSAIQHLIAASNTGHSNSLLCILGHAVFNTWWFRSYF